MVWFEEKVIVEYDSNISHLEAGQAAYDKRRIAAFQQSGFKVINITYNDIQTLSDLDRFFALVRKELNQRKSSTQLKKYYDKRYELFHILFKDANMC